MRKFVAAILLSIMLAAILSGCGAKRKSAAENPSTTGQPAAASVSAVSLPGDQAALKAALKEASAIEVQINVAAPEVTGSEKDAYLDKLLADKQWPTAGMIVLVIYPKDNYDIRFALGSQFFERKVTVDEALTMVRNSYLPKARQQDPAGGLADLIRALQQRMSR